MVKILEQYPSLDRPGMIKLDADNVADWFSEHEFNSLAPVIMVSPWPVVWIEFELPVLRWTNSPQERTGFRAAMLLEQAYDNQGWLGKFQMFVSGDNLPVSSFGNAGYIVGNDNNGTSGRVVMNLDTKSQSAINLAQIITWIAGVAISFAHCKNVTLTDLPQPPRPVRRRAERDGRQAVTYKTLVIDQLRRESAATASPHETHIERALHICRGHFVRYDDSAPLFGKHTGTFWRPAHVRGTDKAGVIVKDYKSGVVK